MWRSSVKISGVQAVYSEPFDDYFLKAVGAHSENSNDPWAVTLQLNETPMEFHIDTGAEVTVISEHASRQTSCPPLTSPQHTLQSPDTYVLLVKGLLTGKLKREHDSEVEEEIYVYEGATQATPRSTSYQTARSIGACGNN